MARRTPATAHKLTVAVVHAEQLGHEVADVGAVGLAKTLLDKASKVARRRHRATRWSGHLRCFGLAETQGQGMFQSIGHGQNASLNRFERSIGGIS
jgi:hypothetical protein